MKVFLCIFSLPGALRETAALYWVCCSLTARNHIELFLLSSSCSLVPSLFLTLDIILCLFRAFFKAVPSRLPTKHSIKSMDINITPAWTKDCFGVDGLSCFCGPGQSSDTLHEHHLFQSKAHVFFFPSYVLF